MDKKNISGKNVYSEHEIETNFYASIQKKLNNIIKLTGLNEQGIKALFSPENMKIWNRAFTHITFSKDDFDSYEWLGDRILEKNLSCLIFNKFPGLSEADYTHIKIEYIKGSTFSEMAKKYDLQSLIRTKGIESSYIINQMSGDIFESFFGALYEAGEKLSKGLGDVITRNVSSKMFTFDEVKDSYSKRHGPDITTITQSMKQLTLFEPFIQKEENNDIVKYTLIFPKEIINYFKNQGIDFVSKKLSNADGKYKTITANNEDSAKHILYSHLSNDLDKAGLTKDFFRDKRFEKLLDECKSIYQSEGINNEEMIIRKLKTRMKKEGYVSLLIKVPGKKGKKRIPMPVEILYGLKDTVNENGLSFEEKIPLLIYSKRNNENKKFIMARLIEEYARGTKIDKILKSNDYDENFSYQQKSPPRQQKSPPRGRNFNKNF